MTKALPDNQKPRHLRHLKDSFLKVNRLRLARTQEYLSTAQCHFLELIPLLFHINHPQLPGYVGEDTAAGVSHYSPGFAALKGMKSLYPGVELTRRAHHKVDMFSLFCMGSMDSVFLPPMPAILSIVIMIASH